MCVCVFSQVSCQHKSKWIKYLINSMRVSTIHYYRWSKLKICFQDWSVIEPYSIYILNRIGHIKPTSSSYQCHGLSFDTISCHAHPHSIVLYVFKISSHADDDECTFSTRLYKQSKTLTHTPMLWSSWVLCLCRFYYHVMSLGKDHSKAIWNVRINIWTHADKCFHSR